MQSKLIAVVFGLIPLVIGTAGCACKEGAAPEQDILRAGPSLREYYVLKISQLKGAGTAREQEQIICEIKSLRPWAYDVYEDSPTIVFQAVDSLNMPVGWDKISEGTEAKSVLVFDVEDPPELVGFQFDILSSDALLQLQEMLMRVH